MFLAAVREKKEEGKDDMVAGTGPERGSEWHRNLTAAPLNATRKER